ncbi:uncharacterized protein LOC131939379 isoform X2 [Physella acuta]|uniref:uncharacterized protein LOC131939379 isoform X2 n=1 Tax=Physella acuta TaxID=109671 RepID=UPI0027DDD67B|nr:uncharacterized protein LOC131939379 isoform X2 [Physella acuta]
MWLATLGCILCVLQIAEQAQVWFGPSQQYLCHCVNDQCNPDGSCNSGSKCSRGWFGKTCQYVDLLSHFNNMHILTDNDDNTCLGVTTQHVDLPLGAGYSTLQIRLVYKKGIKDITTPDTAFGCGSRKYVDNEVVDYFCDVYTFVNVIKLSNKTLHNLCSVYFSGGRNVALKQQAKQSSTHPTLPASLAVDGISDNCGRVFSQTNDQNPTFELPFGKPMTVTRVRIFNRGGDYRLGYGLGRRLTGFEMELFDSGSNVLYRHQDPSECQMIYDLDLQLRKGVTKIEFKQKKIPPGETYPIISFCELEVFGDCDNGFWGLDCKRCNGLCSRTCHKETGQCDVNSLFGENKQFECHCQDSKCEVDGQCKPGFNCKGGWFGNTCQYVDILGMYSNKKILTDGNDNTCLPATTDNVTLYLGDTYTTSLIRFVYKQDQKITGMKPIPGCSTLAYEVKANVFDYFCETDVQVNVIRISNDDASNLCSVYFSGGRNLALKQNATQSSDYENLYAKLAVDGDTNNCDRLFSHTAVNDNAPSFKVQFEKPFPISRIKLYNRVNENQMVYDVSDRLKGFVVEAIDLNNNRERIYTDTSPTQAVYNINFEKPKTVSALQIKQSSYPSSYVSLCEFEAFGDCPDGFWGLDCKNICYSGCSRPCHKETGQCFRKDCPGEFWGLDCKKKCDSGCSKPCHKETGQCIRKDCLNGTWGLDCQNKCDSSCSNDCDTETGQCIKKVNSLIGENKQFACHCQDSKCEVDGQCKPGFNCKGGWFGNTCQYVDILGMNSNKNILTDGNDNTCLPATTDNVTLYLGDTYTTSLIRFVYKQDHKIKGFKPIPGCTTLAYEVKANVFDYFCETDVQVNVIRISNDDASNLCSVYFSGGRNLALKQNATQSSDYENLYAKLAVDGDTNNCDRVFSHTADNDNAPSFKVQFEKPVPISRIKLYNRVNKNQMVYDESDRLKGFVVEAIDLNNNRERIYTDTSPTQAVYSINFEKPKTVSALQIKQSSYPSSYVTLCEFEAFGDCPDGFWGLDCKNKCYIGCSRPCHKETGQCFRKDCPGRFWGLNCKKKCDSGCSKPCHKETGQCIRKDCLNGTWGLDCQNKCDSSCSNDCDTETGQCIKKVNSLFGENKQFECHCQDTKCEVDGQCKPGFNCKGGWFGNTCQYVDILGMNSNKNILTDGNDNTCLPATTDNVTLDLGDTYTTSLIRFVYKQGHKIKGMKPIPGCTTLAYEVKANVFDYICETDVQVNVIRISNDDASNLCSVYFSGGRNLALKQNATQSSDYENLYAKLAVDGDTNNCDRLFSHTAVNDNAPSFKVQFEKPVPISRIKLYNRVNENQMVYDVSDRLKGFVVEAIDSNNNREMIYTDTSPTQAVYNINFEKPKTVSALQIKQSSYPSPIVTLCEFEAFGDCPDGFWGLDCINICYIGCSRPCHKETGQCFRKECDAGHWGLDCQAKCDENCANPCHPETGECEQKPSDIDNIDKYGLVEHIQTYTWVGPKKKYRCNCRGDHCYKNGTCWPAEKCSLRWFGKHCQYVDQLATYDDTHVVTDGDDFTCMHESLSSLTLELGGEFPVTLVRLVTRAELGIGKAIEIEFQGKSSTFKCTDAKIYTEHHTKDIFCRNNERANKLVLKGPGLSTLCSVYFSRGRNFALRQTVVQKPNSEFPGGIVDGNLWSCAYDDLQSENAKDNAFVEIQFDKSVSINRFKLHKRIFGDEDDQNAIPFLLEAFDAQSKSLLNYKNDQPPQTVFDLIIEQIKNVSKIKISQIGSDTAVFFTFCEIEVFGDCDDGSWGLDCKNKCVQSCSNFCHKETGKC